MLSLSTTMNFSCGNVYGRDVENPNQYAFQNKEEKKLISIEQIQEIFKYSNEKNKTINYINPKNGTKNCLDCAISFYNWINSQVELPDKASNKKRLDFNMQYGQMDKNHPGKGKNDLFTNQERNKDGTYKYIYFEGDKNFDTKEYHLVEHDHIHILTKDKDKGKIKQKISKFDLSGDDIIIETKNIDPIFNATIFNAKYHRINEDKKYSYLKDYIDNIFLHNENIPQDKQFRVGLLNLRRRCNTEKGHFLNFYTFFENGVRKSYIIDPQRGEILTAEEFSNKYINDYYKYSYVWYGPHENPFPFVKIEPTEASLSDKTSSDSDDETRMKRSRDEDSDTFDESAKKKKVANKSSAVIEGIRHDCSIVSMYKSNEAGDINNLSNQWQQLQINTTYRQPASQNFNNGQNMPGLLQSPLRQQQQLPLQQQNMTQNPPKNLSNLSNGINMSQGSSLQMFLPINTSQMQHVSQNFNIGQKTLTPIESPLEERERLKKREEQLAQQLLKEPHRKTEIAQECSSFRERLKDLDRQYTNYNSEIFKKTNKIDDLKKKLADQEKDLKNFISKNYNVESSSKEMALLEMRMDELDEQYKKESHRKADILQEYEALKKRLKDLNRPYNNYNSELFKKTNKRDFLKKQIADEENDLNSFISKISYGQSPSSISSTAISLDLINELENNRGNFFQNNDRTKEFKQNVDEQIKKEVEIRLAKQELEFKKLLSDKEQMIKNLELSNNRKDIIIKEQEQSIAEKGLVILNQNQIILNQNQAFNDFTKNWPSY